VAALAPAASQAANYWERCDSPGATVLKTHGLHCEVAGAVLERFFANEEAFDPTPSPRGYSCEQYQLGPRGNGPRPWLVKCRALDSPGVKRLTYVWGRTI
jgi:hypothetical protein